MKKIEERINEANKLSQVRHFVRDSLIKRISKKSFLGKVETDVAVIQTGLVLLKDIDNEKDESQLEQFKQRAIEYVRGTVKAVEATN